MLLSLFLFPGRYGAMSHVPGLSGDAGQGDYKVELRSTLVFS